MGPSERRLIWPFGTAAMEIETPDDASAARATSPDPTSAASAALADLSAAAVAQSPLLGSNQKKVDSQMLLNAPKMATRPNSACFLPNMWSMLEEFGLGSFSPDSCHVTRTPLRMMSDLSEHMIFIVWITHSTVSDVL